MMTLNSHVAIKPIKLNAEPQQKVRGLDIRDATVMPVVETEVLFDSEDFKKGDRVYVQQDALKTPQFRAKLTVEGVEFCLVPSQFIIMVKTQLTPTPTPIPPSSAK